MQRHAFLIMAHNQFDMLEKLIELLDHPNNDIYLHIASTAPGYDPRRFSGRLEFSRLHFMPATKITWGGESMLRCEMAMLREALKGGYDYYHLLSGADMPIKPMREIHEFLQTHTGKEFIYFASKEATDSAPIRGRLRYYHPLQNKLGRDKSWLQLVEKVVVRLQKLLGINRLKGMEEDFAYGAQWFSITCGFASYLSEREEFILRQFGCSLIADEHFLQIMYKLSVREGRGFEAYVHYPDKPRDYMNCLRYIDWSRANGSSPHTFTMDDFEDLMSAPHMFARKFDLNADPQVVQRLYDRFIGPNTEYKRGC